MQTLDANYGVIAFLMMWPTWLASDLSTNAGVVLTPNARSDLEAGAVDLGWFSLLAWVAERHTVTISVFKTGHNKYT